MPTRIRQGLQQHDQASSSTSHHRSKPTLRGVRSDRRTNGRTTSFPSSTAAATDRSAPSAAHATADAARQHLELDYPPKAARHSSTPPACSWAPAASKKPGGSPAARVSAWNSCVKAATIPGWPASDETSTPLHDAAGFAPDAVPTPKAMAVKSAPNGNQMIRFTSLPPIFAAECSIMARVTASYKAAIFR
jgi:hypothetical protein